MAENLLELQGITVQYGGLRALDGVDLSLGEGDVVALMGPNGAGKSTVLKAVFGLVEVGSGRVLWRGAAIIPVPHVVVGLGLAFVPQGRRVFASLSVEENLEVGGLVVPNRVERKRRLHEVIQLFPMLAAKRKARAGSLSGGQQQMLAIARGLMVKPRVLMLDEPTLGLAPKVVQEVFTTIRGINQQQGTAILVVEHNIKSLLALCHRAYVLDKGRVVAHGTPAELKQGHVLEQVFMGKLE